MGAFYCTESDVGPALDIVWGGLNLLGALAIASDPDAYVEPTTGIVVGLSWGVISGAAAAVGFGRSKRCREAKMLLAQRQAQSVARPAAPPAEMAIASVVVDSPRDTIEVGEQVQLVATAYHSSGVSVPTGFRWSSSNDAIAAVSVAGLVSATAPGTVVIAANGSNVVGTTTLVVVPRAN